MMLDQIHIEGVRAPVWFPEANQPTARRMTTAYMREHGYGDFEDVVAFTVDNVAHYLYAGTDQEVWDANDFPNTAPPFVRMWLEAQFPDTMISREHGVTKGNQAAVGFSRVGMLLTLQRHL